MTITPRAASLTLSVYDSRVPKAPKVSAGMTMWDSVAQILMRRRHHPMTAPQDYRALPRCLDLAQSLSWPARTKRANQTERDQGITLFRQHDHNLGPRHAWFM